MTQEQVAILVAEIGFLGVLVGSIISFLSAFIVYLFQKNDQKEKTIQGILENRIKDIESYFADIVEQVAKIAFVATKYSSNQNDTNVMEFNKRVDKLMEILTRYHVVAASSILQEIEVGDLILKFMNSTNAFIGLCTNIALPGAIEKFQEKAPAINEIIYGTFGEIKAKMEWYRLEKLGLKRKKSKKNILSLISFKHKGKSTL